MMFDEWAQKFHTDDMSLLSSGYAQEKIASNKPEHYPNLGSEWPIISMGFLHSSRTRHFVGKPAVAALQNVSCFLIEATCRYLGEQL